jgi:hypothetical protein
MVWANKALKLPPGFDGAAFPPLPSASRVSRRFPVNAAPHIGDFFAQVATSAA